MTLPKVPQRTTPGFAFSMVYRALSECLARRQFGQREIKQVLEFFGKDLPECVFCGSKEVKRWDHLVSIKEGGETVIGNIVPACASCDDSKRDLPFEEWMMSDFSNSPKSRGISDIKTRVVCIKGYIQHFGYTPKSLEKRLSKQEFKRLKEIHIRLQSIREAIEELVNDYRARTT